MSADFDLCANSVALNLPATASLSRVITRVICAMIFAARISLKPRSPGSLRSREVQRAFFFLFFPCERKRMIMHRCCRINGDAYDSSQFSNFFLNREKYAAMERILHRICIAFLTLLLQ